MVDVDNDTKEHCVEYKRCLDTKSTARDWLCCKCDITQLDNVTLTFDVLTPKPNQFMSDPRCTNDKSLAKIH